MNFICKLQNGDGPAVTKLYWMKFWADVFQPLLFERFLTQQYVMDSANEKTARTSKRCWLNKFSYAHGVKY